MKVVSGPKRALLTRYDSAHIELRSSFLSQLPQPPNFFLPSTIPNLKTLPPLLDAFVEEKDAYVYSSKHASQ